MLLQLGAIVEQKESSLLRRLPLPFIYYAESSVATANNNLSHESLY